MGPIEYLWFIMALMFALIGMVRGFLKELGVTIVLIATLFGLDRLIPLFEQLIQQGTLRFLGLQPFTGNPAADEPTNRFLMIVFQIIVVVAVYVAYQGETLAFEGSDPKFPVGTLLSFMVGLVNGYLIAGTLWWVLDHYKYPVDRALIALPLSPTAAGIVTNGLLPMELLGGGTQSMDSLGLLPIILVVLIVLKVVR